MTDTKANHRLDAQDVRRDLATYWAVHDRVNDAVRESVQAELRADPALRPIVDAAPGDGQASERLRTLAARAVEDGDWDPYLRELRSQGATYARMGLAFADWFRVTTAYRRHVVPHLIEAYGHDKDQLAAAMRGKGTFFDLALQAIGDSYLAAREDTIGKQSAALAELSTPVLQIRPGLLLMPIVGVVDTGRSRHLTEALLHAVRDRRARVVVMDITGVPEVDSEVANRIVQAAEAARLMGVVPILTGISAGVAQTLVALGVDLKGLRTIGDLQSGIREGDRVLGVRVVWDRPGPMDEATDADGVDAFTGMVQR